MITVPLSGRKGAGRVTRIDDADLPLVESRPWRLFEGLNAPGRQVHGPYAITWIYREDGRKTSLLMHTLLTGWPRTDHIDHDGLNNQRSNLRPATGSQNQGNRRATFGMTSSRYKGVTWHRAGRKWQAVVTANGVRHYLGLFADEEEAALAYNAAAAELFGEFAFLNEVRPAS